MSKAKHTPGPWQVAAAPAMLAALKAILDTATAFAFAVEEGVALGVLEVFDVPSKTRPARGIRRIIPAALSSGGAT